MMMMIIIMMVVMLHDYNVEVEMVVRIIKRMMMTALVMMMI